MSYTKVPKEPGNTKKCHVCGEMLICIQKPASGNYPAKNQWCNTQDSKPHYFPNGDGTFRCVKPGTATPSKSNTPPVNGKVNFPLDEGASELLADQLKAEKVYVAAAAVVARERYPDIAENSNAFGQIVNAIANRLIALTQLAQSKKKA